MNLTHESPLGTFVRRISRKRAAYLIRAARSRRSRNVTRVENGYALNDCSHIITRP